VVEVFPFKKIAWRSKSIAKECEDLRQRIYKAASYAEYESVKRGLRRCDVYDLTPQNFDNQIKRIFLDELFYLPILRSQQYGGYGHRHYPSKIINEKTFIYGVVAKTLADAVLFHDAGVVDISQRINDYPTPGIDHTTTGRLLGYPDCCIEFFNSTWLRDGCLDPMFEMAQGSEHEKINDNRIQVSGNPRLNRLIRYWGFNIIPFFPHSFDCAEADKFAEWWFQLMRESDSEAADACLEILNVPMTWSLSNCITTVEHPLFTGSANGYYAPEKRVVEWFPP
jgi:hypothetical protein